MTSCENQQLQRACLLSEKKEKDSPQFEPTAMGLGDAWFLLYVDQIRISDLVCSQQSATIITKCDRTAFSELF